MLDVAINHKERLLERFRGTWFKDKYKFWNCTNYYEDESIEESTWQRHQFASVDADGEVIGYIGYRIDRPNELACCLNIVNFTENRAVFGMDAGQAIRDIFERFHIRKLTFSVVIGNPIERTYDRMIEKYGGRIVGIQKQQYRLIDGKYYDEKLYEIMSDDYFSKRNVNES
jgi:RimJ/RimL family protein N-acetyltransferase